MALMEALRVILLANTPLKYPIELHWYSGEEAGLLGSQALAKKFVRDKKRVAGSLILDMVGIPKGNGTHPVIGVATDNVNPKLTKFVQSLVSTYTNAVPKEFRCGYACSDNYPWYRRQFPTSLVFECKQ